MSNPQAEPLRVPLAFSSAAVKLETLSLHAAIGHEPWTITDHQEVLHTLTVARELINSTVNRCAKTVALQAQFELDQSKHFEAEGDPEQTRDCLHAAAAMVAMAESLLQRGPV